MAKFFSFMLLTILCIILPTLQSNNNALQLHTNGRWIVNREGKRVKLACVNWVSHLDALVAEGLSKQPLNLISERIKSMGFNCVRLTWPLFLVTNHSFGFITVRESFHNLGLLDSINGVQLNNPCIIDLPLIKAFQRVVKSLGEKKVMVILDNHMTQPRWCCSAMDGNGFFGDKYFDPDRWIFGLSKMATIFNGVTNVIGMSLRNELRGPKQNLHVWFRYMSKGAEAIHASNPNVLVILSGLNYDSDLSFLQNQPMKLTFNGKLVFEAHQYSLSDTQAWSSMNQNQACGQVTEKIMTNFGFLLEQGWPLFLSEFGIDMRGTHVTDNRFLNCFMAVLAELDLDWALWTLVGSYYINQGVVEVNEYYGILSYDWNRVRNASFLQRVSAIQLPFQGPGLSESKPQKLVIFHPLTGLCITRKTQYDSLRLGPCSSSDNWYYTPQRTLSIKGTYFCLQAYGEGKPAKLGTSSCSSSVPNSIWEIVSDSKMQLSSKVSSNNNNGSSVCLDADSGDNVIVTNTCKCLSIDDDDDDNACDPASQWFKLINSTRKS